MRWFDKKAHVIEAVAALVTAFVAVAALIGVKVQLDATEDIQLSTTARDTYRSHLVLAIEHPEFAQPAACEVLESDNAVGYRSFVNHLLYSAELMLQVDDGWDPVFLSELAPHADYICSPSGPIGDTKQVADLLTQFRGLVCKDVTPCN